MWLRIITPLCISRWHGNTIQRTGIYGYQFYYSLVSFFKFYLTEMREKAVASPDAVVDATGAAVQAHPALAADFVMTRIGVALLPLKLVNLFASGTKAHMLPTPSESNMVGAGAYSWVYRISFKGADVAAKVFNSYTWRGGLQEVMCAVASSPSTYNFAPARRGVGTQNKLDDIWRARLSAYGQHASGLV